MKLVIQDPEGTVTIEPPSRITGASSVGLKDFPSPRTNRIVKLGNQVFHMYIATVDSFPQAKNREALCWEMLMTAIKKDPLLWKKMKEEIQGDNETKNMLIDYVGFSHVRQLPLRSLSPLTGMEGSYQCTR